VFECWFFLACDRASFNELPTVITSELMQLFSW